MTQCSMDWTRSEMLVQFLSMAVTSSGSRCIEKGDVWSRTTGGSQGWLKESGSRGKSKDEKGGFDKSSREHDIIRAK